MTVGGQERYNVPVIDEALTEKAHTLGFDLFAIGQDNIGRMFVLLRGRESWRFATAPEAMAFLQGFEVGRRVRRRERRASKSDRSPPDVSSE